MDLRHWRYFVKVAEYKSFTEAAAYFRVAQSAVSRQVKELEEELNCTLLIRDTRKIELSPAGSMVMEKIRKVIADHDRCVSEARLYQQAIRDQINIGFLGSATFFFLPQIIRDFKTQHPTTKINLMEGNPIEHHSQLMAGNVDLVLSRSMPASAGIKQHLVYSDKLVLAVPQDKRKQFEEKNCAGLDQQFYLLSHQQSPTVYFSALRLLTHIGVTTNNVIEVNDYKSAIVMIEAGLGIGIVPGCLGRLYGDRVHFHRTEHDEPIELVMAYRIGPKPHVRNFLSFMKKRCPIENGVSHLL